MKVKEIWYLIKYSASEWNDDNASRLSAALAYYTVFSMAPLLVIILAIVGFFWGSQIGQSQVMQQLGGILGQQGASAMQSLAQSAQRPTSGIIASIISFIVLVFTASGVFL